MFKILILLICQITISTSLQASLIPENDLRVPQTENLTEEIRFNKLIDKIEKIYTPLVNEQRGHFFITRK